MKYEQANELHIIARDLFERLCNDLSDAMDECVKEHLFEAVMDIAQDGKFTVTPDVKLLSSITNDAGNLMADLDELKHSLRPHDLK